ncbi:type II toxin-antitoxin system prevent-host-death family antitoxin [Thermopetrobacter sp. TC1]|uniref:type II toxin-antitoxin system prevent-host-death family antitoxin n=1 Tax=Thermopetrobacter sp. TC1 TaxID=1495045 RepID=UPI0006925AA2|nr:type II toxin-antitoxin system prevent-host-death family antitoxin [Thermopetrobacter sp. TC1]
MADVKEKARRTWALEDARQLFGELIEKARSQGPQHVMIDGKEAVVVISEEEYKRLSKDKPNFVEFLRSSPLRGVELEIDRDNSSMREVEL